VSFSRAHWARAFDCHTLPTTSCPTMSCKKMCGDAVCHNAPQEISPPYHVVPPTSPIDVPGHSRSSSFRVYILLTVSLAMRSQRIPHSVSSMAGSIDAIADHLRCKETLGRSPVCDRETLWVIPDRTRRCCDPPSPRQNAARARSFRPDRRASAYPPCISNTRWTADAAVAPTPRSPAFHVTKRVPFSHFP
jgi:hypothetical protein